MKIRLIKFLMSLIGVTIIIPVLCLFILFIFLLPLFVLINPDLINFNLGD